MPLLTMYPGKVNSPITSLVTGLSIDGMSLTVANPAVIPNAPNIITIGSDSTAETVLYDDVTLNANGTATLQIAQRAFQGFAKAWPAGSIIARTITEYDISTLQNNVNHALNYGKQLEYIIACADSLDAHKSDLVLTGINDSQAIADFLLTIGSIRADNTGTNIRIEFKGGHITLEKQLLLTNNNISYYGNNVDITCSIPDVIAVKNTGQGIIFDGFNITADYSAFQNTNSYCKITNNTLYASSGPTFFNNGGIRAQILNNNISCNFTIGLMNTGMYSIIKNNTISSTYSDALSNSAANCQINENSIQGYEYLGLHNTGNNCIILGNICESHYDRGLYNTGTSCTISNNYVETVEGARAIYSSGIRCTITGNVAIGNSSNYSNPGNAGIWNETTSTAASDLCVIVGNMTNGISVKNGTCKPATKAVMEDVNTGTVTLRA